MITRIGNKVNCPNCGSAVESDKCPYCGTTFIDFATLKLNGPFYVKIDIGSQIVAAKVAISDMSINCSFDSLPEINLSMVALDNFMEV